MAIVLQGLQERKNGRRLKTLYNLVMVAIEMA